ncbi:MAG: hypothetical protein MK033_09135 [Candidatus Caenarcaniphilales bacterium]|nr:hypothetical protein [Candidatus Caenarcaniphilales bacterium]
MPRLSDEQWSELVKKMKEGNSIASLAREYNITINNIYKRLNKQADSKQEILQLNKLKKENEDLKKIIGRLTLELDKEKKLL